MHIEESKAATALPRFARALDASVTVLGAVARGRLERLRLGMTAERVLDVLASDVLVAKAPGFRTPVSRQSVHHTARRGQQRVRYVW
jgi:nucleotide-binding universal stress UspA family protein